MVRLRPRFATPLDASADLIDRNILVSDAAQRRIQASEQLGATVVQAVIEDRIINDLNVQITQP